MNRSEFEQLRDLPGKTITADITYSNKDSSDVYSFGQVRVYNDLGIEVILNGSYIPDIPTIKFNFHSVIAGGAICRVEINGKPHKDAGRTHKHSVQYDSCARRNLPIAVARPDLEGKTLLEIWNYLCEQANIEHIGRFIEPPE